MSSHSALLDLPAELRVHIFEYVFEETHCQKPLFVLDEIYVQSSGEGSLTATAILLTCRLIYKECLPLLYQNTAVELSLRCEENTNESLTTLIDLGTIEDCGILPRLRHIELEVTFDAHDEASISRTKARLQNFSKVLNTHGKLKTLNLTFLQSGKHYRGDEFSGDVLVDQAMAMKRDQVFEVSRNIAARFAMSNGKWTALRALADNYREGERESYQEISLDYWDRVFPEKVGSGEAE
ncbi:hypothetical protein M409DRAFT_58843 [Zasmidium cellare ATCC 36951]|uniref:F-box domain-containing protein n=1 Tax=Zasmidium cellare ATCC 36951 TaxID=1080233 RepID=A0A6A6C3P4_ZASCE|nr:uncharacterized protein M409DRAFT_58843 [Zasmidium cellare ATCC 36951]KAF2161767.1 hypothetical protein M409DRAFT_58843 [Zasmidium cellare ATCC 36951]